MAHEALHIRLGTIVEVVCKQDVSFGGQGVTARIQKSVKLRFIVEEAPADKAIADNQVERLLEGETLCPALLEMHVQIA